MRLATRRGLRERVLSSNRQASLRQWLRISQPPQWSREKVSRPHLRQRSSRLNRLRRQKQQFSPRKKSPLLINMLENDLKGKRRAQFPSNR